MLKKCLRASVLLGFLPLVPLAQSSSVTHAAVSCTPTGFVRDRINLTAALINPAGTVSGTVDATGCNIGVFYGPGVNGAVNRATVFGANYYGIVNDGGNVTISNSSVHDIGDTPFSGDQHGVGIYFAFGMPNTGSIANNTVSRYQKGGIVVNGGTADVNGNTVRGLGPVDYIAQNGIQMAFGASGQIRNNFVSGNSYTGLNYASSGGILVFGGAGDPLVTGVQIMKNTLVNNDVGIFLNNYNSDGSGPAATLTNDKAVNNTITNDAVTNESGFGFDPISMSWVGYQAGIDDVGNNDKIINNDISGAGYTPISGDSPAFVRAVDTTSFPTTAAKVHANK